VEEGVKVSTSPTWQYWFDMVLFPLLFLVSMLTFSGPLWVLGAAVGVGLWTLVEYVSHRVLHTPDYRKAHDWHHRNPDLYISFPVWQTPAVAAAGAVVAYPNFMSVWSGFILGYCIFMFVHHCIHHQCKYFKFMDKFHRWHESHHAGWNHNYGVTTNIWDRVFGTFKK
jgi:4-hydroxysphinganine ceramide fatty acyl 2-hydroxylase